MRAAKEYADKVSVTLSLPASTMKEIDRYADRKGIPWRDAMRAALKAGLEALRSVDTGSNRHDNTAGEDDATMSIYYLTALDNGKRRKANVKERMLYYIDQQTELYGGIAVPTEDLAIVVNCCKSAADSALRYLIAEGSIQFVETDAMCGSKHIRRFWTTPSGKERLENLEVEPRSIDG